MRDFSKVSPTLHNSVKFRSLKDNFAAKCIYHYLITCPHGNSAGCFDLRDGYACDDNDMELKQYRDCIDTLSKAGLIEVDEVTKTVLITNHMEFNAPANAKHAVGMLAQLGKVSSDRLFSKRFQEIEEIIREKKFDRDASIRAAFDTHSKRYGDGIATRDQDQRPRPDREGDQTLDQTRPETREEVSRAPLIAVAALTGDGSAALGGGEPELPDIPHHLLRTNLMKRSA